MFFGIIYAKSQFVSVGFNLGVAVAKLHNGDKDLCKHHENLSIDHLKDIYDVHRTFLFTNYHFKQYTKKDFVNDIKNNKILSTVVIVREDLIGRANKIFVD